LETSRLRPPSKEISAPLSKGWITESEAALALEIVAKKQDALSAIKESLDAVAKVKDSVVSSQVRLRKNITTLSVDGIRENRPRKLQMRKLPQCIRLSKHPWPLDSSHYSL
jgi:hypothetical protein